MSVLRYPGGKTRAIKILEQYLPNNTKELYSPFFGGGSFELYVQNKYDIKIFANDKFEPLYNFWNCLKLDKKKLVKEVNKLLPINKETFHECKEKLTGNESKFVRAACYFAINRSSFSGATMSGGFSNESGSKRFTESSIKRLSKLNLDNVNFTNNDFADFIETIPKNKFMFLDPPYYLESKLYGTNGDLHEDFDHKTLFDMIIKRKNWILCYNDCEYIRNMYKKFTIIEVNWKYGMNKSKKSSEILIRN